MSATGVFAGLALLGTACPLFPRDWYFSTNGAAYNWTQAQSGTIGTAGTPINADLSSGLQNVIWNHLAPGDRIFLYGGTYSSRPYLPNSVSGTAATPTMIGGVSGEQAIIDGGYTGLNGLAPGSGGNGLTVGGSFITVTNLTVRNIRESGIVIYADTGVTISNVTISSTVVSNVHRTAIGTGNNADSTRAHSILVEGNTVEAYAMHNRERSSTTGWNNGIGIGSSNSVVRNNVVSRGFGEGIILSGISNIAEENVVFDVYSAGLYLDGSAAGTLRRNVVYSTYDQGFFVTNGFGNGPATGIQVATEVPANNPLVFQSSGNLIHDNFVIGGRAGFYYGDYMAGGGFDLSLLRDNTFFTTNASIGLIHFDLAGGNSHETSIISNNVFKASSASQLTNYYGSLAGLTFNDNAWSPAYSGALSGPGDATLDVSFETSIDDYAEALLLADPHALVLDLNEADDLGRQGAYFSFLAGLQSVPEPSSALLLAPGCLLILACSYFRKFRRAIGKRSIDPHDLLTSDSWTKRGPDEAGTSSRPENTSDARPSGRIRGRFPEGRRSGQPGAVDGGLLKGRGRLDSQTAFDGANLHAPAADQTSSSSIQPARSHHRAPKTHITL